MADRLVEFLTDMDKDDGLMKKYKSDPEGTAKAYGLDSEDVKVCVNNDVDAMKKRCDAEGADYIEIRHAN